MLSIRDVSSNDSQGEIPYRLPLVPLIYEMLDYYFLLALLMIYLILFVILFSMNAKICHATN